MNNKVIMPLPCTDFDPSEAAIPWKIVSDAGYQVVFATPDGSVASGDAMMLSGEGLDPWGWIPILKKIRLIGLFLRANKLARNAYQEMIADQNFQNPISYADLKVENYIGLLLPGGHGAGIKIYLESKELQNFVVEFFEDTNQFDQHRPVAAICHGVIIPARSVSKSTNKSVLFGKKTTALTWKLEDTAWKLTKYFARFWDPNYYRTYMEKAGDPIGYMSVEQEVTRSLRSSKDFIDVPIDDPNYKLKTAGLTRDSLEDNNAAWVVTDGNYISARWPGDAHTLALTLVEKLKSNHPA